VAGAWKVEGWILRKNRLLQALEPGLGSIPSS
jgi:hypothetical protein